MKGSDFACEDAYYFLIPSESNPPFWVTHAGISYCDDTYRMQREYSTKTVIEYVYSGTGTLRVEQNEYHHSEGDIYILTEKSRHAYYPDKHDPWTKIYINLRGTAVASIVQAFGLHKKVVYKNCQELKFIFEEIFEVVKKDIPVEQVMEQCGMLVMKLLIRLCQHESREQDVPDEVQIVKRFIDNNYRKNLTMDEISMLVKMQLSDMASWSIMTYSVSGYGDMEITYSDPGRELYVMWPDSDMVAHATELIDRVIAGEILTQADLG